MPMIVQPLTERPLLHVCANLRDRDRAECLVADPSEPIERFAARLLTRPGHNFVLADDEGEPLAACGWLHCDQPGVFWSWLVATPQVRRIGRSMHAFGLRVHAALFGDGARGVITTCLIGHPDQEGEAAAVRWLERLGYQRNDQVNLGGALGEKLAIWSRKA